MKIKRSYVAILGYGAWCNKKNAKLAYDCGSLLSNNNIIVCAGNIGGTFEEAFRGAKDNSGIICLIIEEDKKIPKKNYFDSIEVVPSVDAKHGLISQKCCGAIVIGGGEGTKKIIDRFISLNKLVVAIKETGGILEEIAEKEVYFVENAEDAVKNVYQNTLTDNHITS